METILSYDQLFSLGGTLVLPFWVLMIVLPRWRWTERIIASPLVALGPALIYLALVLPQVGSIMGEFGTLAQVAALLGSPLGATAGWMHFLAFDLLVGRWAYLDSRQREIHPLLMAPTLFLILMFGPIGFLLYLALRAAYQFAAGRRVAPAAVVGETL